MSEAAASSARFAGRLSEIVASGVTGRGPSSLCTDDVWFDAVDLIDKSKSVALVSGFYVPDASAPETDGPTGTLSLAKALAALDRSVSVWTDSLCLECFVKCAEAAGFPASSVYDASARGFDPKGPDLLIYIERLGRAADGAFYNMRKEDISGWTAPLDSYAIGAAAPVIAIGDGGNEAGMGNLAYRLAEMNPSYSSCLCVVESDVCIPVDVSNWGAYALVAAMSVRAGRWLGQTEDQERAMLEALRGSGAVDGVTKECGLSVDGLGLDVQLKILSSLITLVEDALA